jgi:TolA-binding protein
MYLHRAFSKHHPGGEYLVSLKTLFGLAACALLASPASAQLSTGQQKATSDSEKLEASADHLARMKVALKQVLGRVEEARNEKDVVKLNCVNEKLTQIKALLKVAEQADIALHEAVANRDPGAESEFSKVAIARAKIDALRGESDQCIGQLAYIVDEKTTVEVQQPGNLPDAAADAELFGGEARRGPPFPVPPVVRPPPASPSGGP